jgi:tRNA1Val (adenine37-N6)-methyltransferase
MDKTRQPFEFKQFTIHQSNVSLPVTTDACLFGAKTEFQHPKHILDMGCGSGLLMFMMHQKYPQAFITGIDIHESSIETCQHNILYNQAEKKLSVAFNSWWEYNPSEKFDAIICNPPFFEKQLPSVDPAKRNARHTQGYSLSQLLSQALTWLKPEGEISLLLSYTPLENIQNEWSDIKNQDVFIRNFQHIRSKKDKHPHLTMIHLQRLHIRQKTSSDHIIYCDNLKFTDESRSYLSPFLQERALK